MKHLPNILSSLRMVGAFALLLLSNVSSILFEVLYIVCGISDIVDGWLARKLKCVTRTGALLDSLADICFIACCAWKLLPIFELPQWLWLWAGVIVAIKVVNQLSDVWPLLLSSHPREQVGGIPVVHCSSHDILHSHPHRHCGLRRHVCCHTRGTFHKNKK